DQMEWPGWDREEVHRVFDTLQFRVLRDRLYQYLEPVAPEAESGFAVDGTVIRAGQLTGWLADHVAPGQRVGVAVAGSFGRGAGTLTAVAIATGAGPASWFAPDQLDESDERALSAFLSDPATPKVMHDAKRAMLAFHAHGWRLSGLDCETALAAYLVRPDQRSYDLADLALRHLHKELRVDEADDGQLTLDGLGSELGDDGVENQLMSQAAATLELAEALEGDLEQQGGTRLLREVELPLIDVLGRMEQTGIAADVDYLTDLEAHFAGEVKAAAQAAYGVVGREFNLGSPKQLQQVLFDELSLPKTRRIKSGYTTDADALQGLFLSTGHPVLEHLLRHRDVAKLKSTVDGLLKSVSDDGRIHTTFYQTVAATGRLSSTDPNLQNVPIRTEEGRRIRRAFVVGEGYDCLLTADYSQIEMRIMAHLSEDAGIVEAFQSGFDFHAATAANVFGVAPEQVTPEQRRRIKAMNYGLAYGLSAYGLSNQLGISPDEARVLMEEYFTQFGGVRDYLRAIVAQARREGYTETIMGRRRFLPDLVSDNRQR
ncbi:MAG: DNA polymerase, partial [Micromonosporaceae bacterium]